MIVLQAINKILISKDFNLVIENGLTEEWFVPYIEEFSFIQEHYNQYKVVPDPETFLEKFPEFDYFEVQESDAYILDKLLEEYTYRQSLPILKETAKLLQGDSNDAIDYLNAQLKNVVKDTGVKGVDLIGGATSRYADFKDRKEGKGHFFITTGFPELDEIFEGWQRGEEYAVLFARTGQGKSWVLVASLAHAWQIGNNVGYISPEMSPSKIGYRFDSVYRHFSNTKLIRGVENIEDYESYINELAQRENKFIVATPEDFARRITVSKLRSFCIKNKLSLLGIDGISYMRDERAKRGDNKTAELTNISEDILQLSKELKIPIIVVVQSNREALKEKGEAPDLEHLKDSDGIGANATKVIALRQVGENGLEFRIRKHRDGRTGGKIIYQWDIDKGEFMYIPDSEDMLPEKSREKHIVDVENKYKDDRGKIVF